MQVGMTQIARDQAQIIAPKIYGYYDNVPNPINAEVVLLELVCASGFLLSLHRGLNLRTLFIFSAPR
jgi:hypothetical protein